MIFIDTFNDIVKKNTPKSSNISSMFLSFIVGGLIGLIAQVLVDLYINIFNIDIKTANTCMIISLIFISSLLTSLGFFDKVIEKVKCGIIIPITGFSHSIMSAAIEYRKDGLILGLGSNVFKISGSVLLYGTISAFFISVIRLIVGV